MVNMINSLWNKFLGWYDNQTEDGRQIVDVGVTVLVVILVAAILL